MRGTRRFGETSIRNLPGSFRRMAGMGLPDVDLEHATAGTGAAGSRPVQALVRHVERLSAQ